MIGNRILPVTERPSQALLERFRGIPTPLISDNMARLYGTSGLTPFHRSKTILGTAFTVKTLPGDNLLVHKSLETAEPGDIIVVDGGGEVTAALIGEIMMLRAAYRKLAGFVIDGAIRDSEAFSRTDYPCFARCVSHRGPHKNGPGEIGVPVVIGRMIVMPGDILVGDADGLISIRPSEAEDLLPLVLEKIDLESTWIEETKGGSEDTAWIDDALRSKGYGV